MRFHFKIYKKDHLLFHLYCASHNTRIIKQRQIGRWILSLILLIIGLIFMLKHTPFFGYYFIAASVAAYLICPAYTRWFYKQTFRYNINRQYRKTGHQDLTLDIDADSLEITVSQKHQKIYLDTIQEIVEISSHYFIILRPTLGIIIPKDALTYPQSLHDQLAQISKEKNIPYNNQTNWHWK